MLIARCGKHELLDGELGPVEYDRVTPNFGFFGFECPPLSDFPLILGTDWADSILDLRHSVGTQSQSNVRVTRKSTVGNLNSMRGRGYVPYAP